MHLIEDQIQNTAIWKIICSIYDIAELISSPVYILPMRLPLLCLLALPVLILGLPQAEAYDGKVDITNLIFYSFDMGDYFILEGTFGPELIIVEPVRVTITEKDTNTIVHRNGIKIYDLGEYVQEGTGGRVWSFSGVAKISLSQTVELGNNIPDRLNPDTPYTMKVQYDDKYDEIDFELAATDEEQIIISDKTVQGFQTGPASEHSPDDSDITRYVQLEHGPILSGQIYSQEDHRVSTVVRYVFENADGDNNLGDRSQKGTAPPHGFFHSYAQYFFENIGRFYIHIIHDVDGKITENPNPYEFIIVEQHSDAAINGCSDGRQVIVKPGYTQTICVFSESVEKLVQRGWISD